MFRKEKKELITMSATGTITVEVTYIKSTMTENEIRRSFMKEIKMIERRISSMPYVTVEFTDVNRLVNTN
ncbi:MAG: hypothetical protein N2V78_09370 [Methanophagales archaeon]|nr:hypothetical protein [Methanophagales archaeon]